MPHFVGKGLPGTQLENNLEDIEEAALRIENRLPRSQRRGRVPRRQIEGGCTEDSEEEGFPEDCPEKFPDPVIIPPFETAKGLIIF